MIESQLLKQGARGASVQVLHGLLCRLGHHLPSDELKEQLFGPHTHRAICDEQVRFHLDVDGEVDGELVEALEALLKERCRDDDDDLRHHHHHGPGKPPPLPDGKLQVHGSVLQARGGFVVGARVRAFEVDLRHEHLLGEATADARGRYSIEYSRGQIGNGVEDSADLFVRAYASSGTVLAESPTYFNAPSDATIDLVVGGEVYVGPSEYERLIARVTPSLDGVAPQNLTLGDVHWLQQETGLPFEWIGGYALASAMAHSTSISTEVFYAFIRESIPFRGSALYARPAAELEAILRRAIQRNIIGARDDAWIQSNVMQLQKQAATVLLGGNTGALGGVLAAAGVPASSQQAFADAYLGNTATTEQLWQKLTNTVGATAVNQLQTGMQWAALTLNHAPLVSALTGTLGAPHDVARLSLDDWRVTIDQVAASGQTAVPDRIQAATEDQRRAFFAQQLHTIAQTAFPTIALATQLKTSSLPTAAKARQYLDAHPSWDIQRVPARQFLGANPTDTATALAVAQMQRVHRVTSEPTWSVKLAESGWTSAQSIARASLESIAAAIAGTEAQARAVRNRARAIVDAAAVLHGRFSQRYNMPPLPAVPQMQEVAVEQETYQDVFGPAPLCGCDECGSVLGAAAYLVDLFQFLKTWSQPAWNELFRRRPDLRDLELSCTNTLTPLPLIDVVNELLEDVAKGQPPTARQTTWTADDLAANPEHLDFAAYQPLPNAVYPWTLPFDLALEEARAYLKHLGVSRHDVLLTLASTSSPDEVAQTTELLGMTPIEWTSIATAAPVPDGQPDPNWGGLSNGQLTPVETFLRRSELVAAELPPLFNTRFVNPDATPIGSRIGISTPDNLCNPVSSTILNLRGDGMDRIRRLVRLRRRLGWTFAELDAVIAAIAGGVLDANGLLRIARFQRIRRATGLPLFELLSWWSPLSSTVGPSGSSLWDDVFVSRAGISVATSPDNAATPDPLRLDAAGEPQGAGAGVMLRTHLPRIIAALNLSADEMAELVTPDLPAGLDAPLSRISLSAVYRALSLSRAANLSAADYARLRRLSTLQPFAPDIDSARAFLERAAAATATSVSLAEWAFLLRDEPIEVFAFDDASVLVFLTELRTALQTIDAERSAAAIDPDPVGVVRRKLAKLATGPDLTAAIAFLDEAAGVSLATLPSVLTQLTLPSATVSALQTATPPTDDNIRNRYLFVRDALIEHLALLDKTSLVIKRAAAGSGGSVKLVAALVAGTSTVRFSPPGGDTLLNVLLAPAIADGAVAIDPTSLPDAYRGLRLFGKEVLLATRLALGADELTAIQSNRATLGWLDWAAFPVRGGDAAIAWEAVSGLLQYVVLRNGLPRGRAPLYELFQLAASQAAGGPADSLLVALAQRTGWEDVAPTSTTPPSLSALAATLGLVTVDAYRTIDAYVRLGAAVALAKRMGLPGKTIAGWPVTVTPSLAADIKGAARSKHDVASWHSIAKALRDPLREQQRDALLAYAIGAQGVYADANAAFDALLIDVQMSACMRTSRIKQAIGSTQLFIERCLLGAEGDALLLPAEASWQWKWMREYRVWEANRQVFLYPENWLQPELRTDKTPQFRELEDELHQRGLTSGAAEDALHHYLEKLDGMAKLEIVGFVNQPDAFNALGPDDNDTSAVHVIGRTQAAPSSYYYRRLERGWHWTPWEAINVDIVGDHVVPVLWHRRLFLFWLQFHEKTDQKNQHSPSISTGGNQVSSQSLPPPPKHLEIQMVWTERKSDRWLPRRMSKGVLIADPCDNDQLPRFVVDAYAQDGGSGALHLQVVFNGAFGSDETPADQRCQVGEFVFGSCTDQPTVKPFASVASRNVTPPSRCDRAGVWFQETTGLSSKIDDPYEGWAACILASRGIDPNQFIKEQRDDDSLYLLRGRDTTNRDIAVTDPTASQIVQTLKKTPGLFTLSWPHNQSQFFSSPFFFWDQDRVFYVTTQRPVPIDIGILFINLPSISPGAINGVVQAYVPPPVIVPPSPPPPVIIERVNRPLARASTRDDLERTPIVELLSAPPPAATGLTLATDDASSAPSNAIYRFFPHDHAYACAFLERLDRFGIDGFFAWSDDPAQQQLGQAPVQLLSSTEFATAYQPVSGVVDPRYPDKKVDFSPCGAYAQHNWEIFLHIPVYIANRLRTEQSFDEALRWLGFVFDPTTPDKTVPPPKRYWKMARLRDEDPQNGDIVALLQNLAEGRDLGAANDCEAETLTAQIRMWRHDPFDPHAIARLRPVAYMKCVFNLYVQTLIDWGDVLFKQNTIESINQATLRYVMAAELLGPRPDPIPLNVSAPPVTYQQMLNNPAGIDAFSDELENIVPVEASNDPEAARFPISFGPGQVFCVPPNAQLLGLWDTVADRLFKIRHCMNIAGQMQQLPLFEPPINPALLIAAQQAGLDLASAVNEVEASIPRYRFAVVYERARELVAELRQLGAALQAALEKRDGEDLALLRSSNELSLLNAVREVRKNQVDESAAAHDALVSARSAMQTRVNYFHSKSQELMNDAETAGLALLVVSQVVHLVSQGLHLASGVVGMVPQFKVGVAGVGGTPTATAEFGGTQVKAPVEKAAAALEAIGGAINVAGSICTTLGGYQRRKEDMGMQSDAGVDDLASLDQQILAAQIRGEIAQKELDNHELQIEQASLVDSFLRSKFTNRDLFDWMSGQLSALYFQTYQLAFDLARRAERAFRFELGLFDDQRTFIQFGYWDNLKQGLLAGERLSTDLVRLHATYLEENKRELELTKHVSLALTDPIALLALRQDGSCTVTLSEQLFDLDMPGLYLRRIKSVGLSIPCVSGTYVTVACKLTLLSDSVRINANLLNNQYVRQPPNVENRFLDTSGGTQSIVTSSAQNDAGLFDVNLRDERYLPFEGAGVISQWKLELVKEAQQFDWTTISDAVLHVRYTARDGGELLRQGAVTGLTKALQSGVRLFSVSSEFRDALTEFLNPPAATPGQSMTLRLVDGNFPYPVQGKSPKLNEWLLLIRWTDGSYGNLPLSLAAPTPAAGPAPTVTAVSPWPPSPADPNDTMGLDWAAQNIAEAVQAYRCINAGLGAWTLSVAASDLANLPAGKLDANGHINADALDDILLVVGYAA